MSGPEERDGKDVFRDCLRALDDVTKAFNDARNEVTGVPSRYEADFAAFQLMQQVLLHVNCVSEIAAIPRAGSHLASAWVLLRSAFETGLTALWLTIDDDWKEREARWLGWVAGWHDHYRKLASDLRPVNSQAAQEYDEAAARLVQRRDAIARLLPKAPRDKRPKMEVLMTEAGIDKRYYIAYRIGSQVAHGGPGMEELTVRLREGQVFLGGATDLSQWKDPLRMAGWCIAEPGIVVLRRAGVSEGACAEMVDKHNRLRDVTELLEDSPS